MQNDNKNFDEELTQEEMAEFEEKFCHGTMKAKVLSKEEVEQLKKEGRI